VNPGGDQRLQKIPKKRRKILKKKEKNSGVSRVRLVAAGKFLKKNSLVCPGGDQRLQEIPKKRRKPHRKKKKYSGLSSGSDLWLLLQEIP
jgi:hypothetical protein